MDQHFEHKLKKAFSYEEEGSFLHALQIYKSLFESYSDNKILIVRMANLYDKMNNITAASHLLTDFIAENPHNDDIILFYGELLLRNSIYEKAVDVLALVSGEQKSIAKYMLAISYFNLKEYEIAKINLESFINEYRGSNLIPDAYVYLAKTYLANKDFDTSLKVLKEAEKIFSLNWELHLVLAQIYYFKEMLFHAYDEIKKAIKLDSNHSIFEWAGKILIKMGEYENAEKYLRNSLKDHNPKAEIYSLLGITYLRTNNPAKANECFQKALDLDPSNKIANENIINQNTERN